MIRYFLIPGATLALLIATPAARSQFINTSEPVGIGTGNRHVTPVNQILTPAGIQVELPGARPQGIALSPDGRILVASGKTHELIVVNPADGTIVQRATLPSEKSREPVPDAVSSHILDPDKEGQLSFTGLVFSPDGRRIYLSNVNGSVKVFAVDPSQPLTNSISPLFSIALPSPGNPMRKEDIPSGLALSKDGHELFIVLNLSNRLLVVDASTGKQLRLFDVGFAPYDVVISGTKAYVSNWGGRRPGPGDLTGPAGRDTRVRVDPIRHIASEGSVTVIDLVANKVIKEILVGLHSSAMALSPNGRHLVIANAGSDSLSILDTRSDDIIQTFSIKWQPKDYFGASPNALVFDPNGKTLYVCNGTQNAVAVVSFNPRASKLLGLIPTGWFPGAIAFDKSRQKIHTANLKGPGTGRRIAAGEPLKFGSHQYFGSLSLIPVPDKKALAQHTKQVLANCRRDMIEASQLPPRPGQPPRPVPERVGEPSPIKHVIYIIKENRTYDQVLGDIKEGNGDPKLVIYGEAITPNQHKIVREFVLLDNTYCSGILSADGHEWADSAFATDYMEKSFAGFPRSYPDGMEDDDVDAIAYSPAGFIWDNAIAHGKSLRVYGEFAITDTGWKDPKGKAKPTSTDYYNDFKNGTGLLNISSRPAIGSLRSHLCTNTVGWEMKIPDVFRAAQFIKELHEFEMNGNLPNLMIICLPNDHTSGTTPGAPTPSAHVADNDLAMGQILEAVSKSPYWKETAIFAIEDDPQDGWDHVSGYRTTAYVASPYAKRGAVIHTQYNQTSILRTIELILGLPPMNLMDASATPMFDCFTDAPILTPFASLPSNVPLDQVNPPKKAIHDPVQLYYAKLSERLPLEKPDACDEDTLNRILWFAQKGTTDPYPSWAILPKSARPDRD